jgi:integrase
MTQSEPPSPPSRPRGVRAVRAKRADGSVATYWYGRLTNTRLPDPADPAFPAALEAARRRAAPRYAPGTLRAVLRDWRASQEYAGQAVSTRRAREHYLAAMDVDAWSARPVAGLTRAEPLALRDAIAAARGPGAATVVGQALATVLAWAVDRGYLRYNPLARLRALPLGGLPTWTEAQARHAMTAWPEHVRRAVVLAYDTGQRRGDLVGLTWTADDPAAGVIVLMPEKTCRRRERRGMAPLRIALEPAAIAELNGWRETRTSTHLLTRLDGTPWSRSGLSNAVYRQLAAEGWNTKLGLHGLRKARAVRLVEEGATTSEVAASIGWTSLSRVELYTRAADQERLSRAAVKRLATPLAKTGKDDDK